MQKQNLIIYFIGKDISSSIKNIDNIFSILKDERDSNLSLMNRTLKKVEKFNSSIDKIDDIQTDILKELQKDWKSELRLIIKKLNQLKRISNINEEEILNSKAAKEIKDLWDNHYEELYLFVKNKISNEIEELKSKYCLDKMGPKFLVTSEYPKISLAELITQFPKIYKTFERIYNHYKSTDENDFIDTPEIAKHIYKLMSNCFGDYIEYTKYFEDLVQFKNNAKDFLKEIGNIQIANQDYEIKDEIKNLKKSIMNNIIDVSYLFRNQPLQDNQIEWKKAIKLKIDKLNQIFTQLNNHLAEIDKIFESEEQNKENHLAQIAEKEKYITNMLSELLKNNKKLSSDLTKKIQSASKYNQHKAKDVETCLNSVMQENIENQLKLWQKVRKK